MAAPLEPRLPDWKISNWPERITQRLNEWMRSIANEVNQKVTVRNEGTRVGTRDFLNFHAGANVGLTIAEDVTNDEIDITIAASGGAATISYSAALGLANSNVNGSQTDVSRADHQHKRDVRVAKAGTDVGTRNRLNLIEGTGVTLTVSDDAGNDEVDITIAAAGITSFSAVTGLANSNVEGAAEQAARADHQHKRDVRVAKAGTDVGTRNRINFIEGANVTLTIADDAGDDEVDVTVAATASVGLHTIYVPATAMVTRTTLGANIGLTQTSNLVMLGSMDFDAAQTEYAQFTAQMPKSWNEGLLQAKFVWMHATATDSTSASCGVVWAIQASAYSSGDNINVTFSTTATAAKIGINPLYCWITDATSSFTVAGTPSASDFVVFQVSRARDDAADTFGADAKLLGVSILYSTDAGTDD